MLKSHNCLLSTVFKTSQGPSIFKNTVFYISMKADICGILTLNLNISIAEKQCPSFLPSSLTLLPHHKFTYSFKSILVQFQLIITWFCCSFALWRQGLVHVQQAARVGQCRSCHGRDASACLSCGVQEGTPVSVIPTLNTE